MFKSANVVVVWSHRPLKHFKVDIIVVSVITYTLSTGAVGKPHLPGVESVYLFLKFTIKLLNNM